MTKKHLISNINMPFVAAWLQEYFPDDEPVIDTVQVSDVTEQYGIYYVALLPAGSAAYALDGTAFVATSGYHLFNSTVAAVSVVQALRLKFK